MIKINLIPPEYLERLDKKAMVAKVVFAGVLAAALVFLVSAWYFNKARALEARAGRLDRELQSLQGDVDKAKAIEAQIAEVQRYLNAIGSINRGRLLYPHFMQDLLVNLPGTIWFTGIGTTSKGETLSVTLPVRARSTYDLAYWINVLETDPKYAEATLGGISVADSESGKTLTTSIQVKYTYK
ncbi:MAG: hypothetical protein HY796_08715 [Elusimicrobia bacterium]|nr:hypothetical protein [Elusimicrobiota bacterium]